MGEYTARLFDLFRCDQVPMIYSPIVCVSFYVLYLSSVIVTVRSCPNQRVTRERRNDSPIVVVNRRESNYLWGQLNNVEKNRFNFTSFVENSLKPFSICISTWEN